MTIAAAYLTTEGVVLGADSTSSIVDSNGNITQLLNHAQKVFEVGEDASCAICMYGAGDVCRTSHRTIAALLGDKVAAKPEMPMSDIANELAQLVGTKITTSSNPFGGFLGYFLGGCDVATHEPSLYSIEFRDDSQGKQLDASVTQLGVGPVFGGSFNYFNRVFTGIDPALQAALATELEAQLPNVEKKEVADAFKSAITTTVPRFSASGWDDLPIREAIDFVHTYLHITVKVEKFQSKVPVCGGPVEIAFVTSDRKLRWARHKRFDSAIIEHHNHPGQ